MGRGAVLAGVEENRGRLPAGRPAMTVLVLWACLAGQPQECTSVNLPGRYPVDQCRNFARAEARDFENRHPERRVTQTWCLRMGGLEA